MAIVNDPDHPDGVYEDKNRTNASLDRARLRKGVAAMELYSRVFSWERVAQAVGYPNARAARVAAEKALEEEFRESPKSQEFMRRYVAKAFDNLIASVATKAFDQGHPEHLTAVKTARDLLASKSKLLGLDAPLKVTQVDPTQEEIEEYLNRTIGPREFSDFDILEDDIEDAEIIEDRELEA